MSRRSPRGQRSSSIQLTDMLIFVRLGADRRLGCFLSLRAKWLATCRSRRQRRRLRRAVNIGRKSRWIARRLAGRRLRRRLAIRERKWNLLRRDGRLDQVPGAARFRLVGGLRFSEVWSMKMQMAGGQQAGDSLDDPRIGHARKLYAALSLLEECSQRLQFEGIPLGLLQPLTYQDLLLPRPRPVEVVTIALCAQLPAVEPEHRDGTSECRVF